MRLSVLAHRTKKKTIEKKEGFRWFGKTRDGVPILVGRWDKPPLWFCVFVLFAGVFFLAMSIAFWFAGDSKQPILDPLLERMMNKILSVTMAAIGLGKIVGGTWMLLMRRRLRRLTPSSVICE